MNDLKTLYEIGAELDPPVAEPPDRLRGRVLFGLAGQPRRRPAMSLRWPAMPRRVALVGGLAVVLTAGVIAAQTLNIGDRAPAANAEAAKILRNAAQAAQRQPALKARPDQFVYIESMGGGSETIVDEKGERTLPGVPELRRAWLSVDRTRDGLVQERPQAGGEWVGRRVPNCRDGGVIRSDDGQIVATECPPRSPYRADLPTDVDGMRRYLASITYGGNPRDLRAFATIRDLIQDTYIPPRSMAALLEVAAEIEDTIVVRNVVDLAGRRGVAVAMNVRGVLAGLIFDAETYEYLGEQGVALRDVDIWHKGDVTGGEARLRVAIVDRAGEMPR
jgi:hypothetical protein